MITIGVDFGITQVVDGNWGVHAVIKKDIFAGGESLINRRGAKLFDRHVGERRTTHRMLKRASHAEDLAYSQAEISLFEAREVSAGFITEDSCSRMFQRRTSSLIVSDSRNLLAAGHPRHNVL